MKKPAISFLIFICALFCALSFAACGMFGGDNGGTAERISGVL